MIDRLPRRRPRYGWCVASAIGGLALLLSAFAATAQGTQRLSITTGGTGGVYLPLGEGMARLLSRYLPGVTASAEASQGSVENLKLIGSGKAELGFAMVDAAWQALHGTDAFGGRKVEPRTLLVLYPNRMQLVTAEGRGIVRFSDLKGRRVSTGAPGSGVEVMALRVLEAAGIDPSVDIQRQQLGVDASVAAMREGTLDAFFWVGGIPTPAVSALATTPGFRLKLIDHAEFRDAMNSKYGPFYEKGLIPAVTYPGMERPARNIDVWNILVASATMSDQMAYNIVKTLIERKPELVAMFKEAQNIDLKYQRIGSPIPYHPGARRYLEERGVKF